jgi:hypothetical protein
MLCGHEGCTCEVDEAGGFCSDHCRERGAGAGAGGHICECGHTRCRASSSEADARTEHDIQEAFE